MIALACDHTGVALKAEIAKMLEQYGYDAFDVDVGSYDSWYWSHPPMYQKDGLYLKYAKAVKEVVKVPVICAGKLANPDLSSQAVKDGWIDIVSLGRPLLADANYANKLRSGRKADIRPCINCQEGCMGRIQNFSLVNCAVNPQCARERVFAYNPILRPKKVVIVGGGIAGMEAARVLATRGHKPVIFEKCGYEHLNGNEVKPVASTYYNYPKDQIFEISACGFGGVLMNVPMVKAIEEKYGLPFAPMLGFGEDISFCLRAQELGYKIWCDSRVKMGHIGLTTFTEANLC